MRKVDAWQTPDGAVFLDEQEAAKHERILQVKVNFSDWYYDLGDDRLFTTNRCVTADDFLNWYFAHENALRDILLATGDENENR